MFKRVALAAMALLLAAQPAAAQYSFVGSRAAIGGTGFIDWSVLGPAGTDPGHPLSTGVTNTSITATATDGGSSFRRVDQNSGWGGNFFGSEALLWTNGNNGPMTIMFDAAISAVGANFQADFYGAFSARISALDALGMEIAGFDFFGTSNGDGDGSAVFAGVSSALGDIRGVRFTGLTAAADPNDFAINRLEVNEIGGVSVVPEPSTVALSAAGLLALAAFARRRRTAA